MATTFKLKVTNNITTQQTVLGATAQTVVVGLIINNDSGSDTTITVSVTDSSAATTVNILTAASLPAGSNIAVLNNNSRMVLENLDGISVLAGAAVDVAVSYMEIT